ncbi:MAG TPA: hypothetical protein DCY14_01555, partial [Anaerolineae bacterium]|nr:hypothetical protein [Anaerolineae bacterium]
MDNEYYVLVDTGTGTGTIRLDVPVTASIKDMEDNNLAELPYTNGESYYVFRGYPDPTPPSVNSIDLVWLSPTSASSVDFTITFSEDVTGVSTSAPFN